MLSAVSRCSHLDSGYYFLELVCLASACSGVLASIHGCFWKIFSYHLVTLPEPFATGNLDTWPLFLRNSWLDSGYRFFDCSWSLREGELGSCGRLTSCSSGSFSGRVVWRSVHSRCFDCLDCLSLWHLAWPLFQDYMRRVWEELITQVMSSISLSDCRCIDRCGVSIPYTHIKSSEKQQPHSVSIWLKFVAAVDMMDDVERGSGAARRRRERRLRSWLKHERQTVRMVLAETFHHSSTPFSPKGGVCGKARAAHRLTVTEDGKDQGGHVLHFGDLCGQGRGVLPAVWRGRHLVGDAAGTGLGPSAAGVGSAAQPGARRRRLPLRADSRCSCAADVLEIFRQLDTAVPEQVIEVPTISQDTIQQRLVDRDLRLSRMAEQLAEVPTILYFLSQATFSSADRRHSSSAWSWGFGR